MKVKTYFSYFFVIAIVLFSNLEESLAATKSLSTQPSRIQNHGLEQSQKTVLSVKDEIGRASILPWQARAFSSMTLASNTEECTVGKEKIHCP